MHNEVRTQDESEKTTRPGRRTLLRTGGAVVAGMAGIAVAETVTAGSANAAAGDPVAQGAANDAGTTATSLTSAVTTAATMAIANTAGVAPLRVTQQAFPTVEPTLVSGDLANYDGDLYYTAGGTGGPFFGLVYTEWTANKLVPIKPQRVLDTRSATGRLKILTPGQVDGAGRLIGGRTIVIDLSDLAIAADAAYCNLTAVTPTTGGYMTLWPGGPRPGTSSINFAAKSVIANFAVTGVSGTDTVSIFANTTTHVLLDIAAFAVGSPAQVSNTVLPSTAASSAQRFAARARNGTLPRWAAQRMTSQR